MSYCLNITSSVEYVSDELLLIHLKNYIECLLCAKYWRHNCEDDSLYPYPQAARDIDQKGKMLLYCRVKCYKRTSG